MYFLSRYIVIGFCSAIYILGFINYVSFFIVSLNVQVMRVTGHIPDTPFLAYFEGVSKMLIN